MGFSSEVALALRAFVGDRPQKSNELTWQELYSGVAAIYPMHGRSFSRTLKKLGIERNDNGFYTYADAIVIMGWAEHKTRFNSCQQYMATMGKKLYAQCEDIDFGFANTRSEVYAT
jgi:hypothetical protein